MSKLDQEIAQHIVEAEKALKRAREYSAQEANFALAKTAAKRDAQAHMERARQLQKRKK